MAIETTQVGNSNTDIYTSNGNSAITFLSLTNYTASPVTVDVHLVPSGDSAANVNLVLKSLEITAEDTYQFYAGGEKVLLEDGDKFVAVANTAAAINSVVSYTAI